MILVLKYRPYKSKPLHLISSVNSISLFFLYLACFYSFIDAHFIIETTFDWIITGIIVFDNLFVILCILTTSLCSLFKCKKK